MQLTIFAIFTIMGVYSIPRIPIMNQILKYDNGPNTLFPGFNMVNRKDTEFNDMLAAMARGEYKEGLWPGPWGDSDQGLKKRKFRSGSVFTRTILFITIYAYNRVKLVNIIINKLCDYIS